ncbi:MAG TPA: site-specific integrase [Solirubrobacterales bacterium]|nr:site-specific integrase [Solirubrobacterales bacterium]
MAAPRKRHTRTCASRKGGTCRCDGGWEAAVYSPRDGKKIRKTFPQKGEASSWQADAKRALDQGALRAAGPTTLKEAADTWLEGAEKGTILNRSGNRFKPSTLRGYRRDLREHLIPRFGAKRLTAITTADIQALVDELQEKEVPASTIRNRVRPLQVIYRRAKARDGIAVDPTDGLELPAPDEAEVEIVSPEVAARLVDAVPEDDQAIWATALEAGLRYGEIRALRRSRLDFAAGEIDVKRSWDPYEGDIEPKTKGAKRRVPMPARLRARLLAHLERQGPRPADALVFGEDEPFNAEKLYRTADAAWKAAGITERLRLHMSRHSYASFLIAAGANAKTLSVLMGHASIQITFDRYGHLMPGAMQEAVDLLDTFLTARIGEPEEAPTGSEAVAEIGAESVAAGARTGAH